MTVNAADPRSASPSPLTSVPPLPEPRTGGRSPSTGGYRLEPAYYEPLRVPEEVLQHTGAPTGLPVGSPGKVGILQLGFDRNRGRTELVQHYQKSPLQIMRPLYFNLLRPDLPYTYLMSSGGGILQGDRQRTDMRFGPGTSAHVTTQAHTRVYRMDHGYATAVMNIEAGEGSYVEYLPDPVVPFADSRFYQQTSVVLDESATLVLGETVYAGRLARGERHAYDVYASDLEVRRPDGRLVALDRVRLCPKDDTGVGEAGGVNGLGVLAGHDVLAMLYVFTPLVPAAQLAETVNLAVSESGGDLIFGVSTLPGDAGVWMRLVGNDTVAVAAANTAAAAAVHELLTGKRAPVIRKT
ncbi:urease accessory protein UreD [Arthrobacter caoxuetaonis]|uniref:Urease accessory protein UreD n=1 Tax=Arthrobacter caoxuetaonis TaxID=2886935 RepID=A0A9X1MIE4_9MICC|nr:urease accessory protein UreD [Arthrobacter caoxuetaonis]MCC3299119.1 urease accessory protein UreD [Arthrobacter caoxuetaonis]USQ58549.1 urease accessory protein UreD [Arthrobacter caoxuetaonis]